MARRRPLRYLGPWLVTAATAGAIVAGWAWRDEGHLTPEQGLGYWLGIAGATAMLLLLVYPLRKRMPSLRWLGGIPAWFQLHMLLGVLGPLLILYHCNFSFGAPNSNIALSTMLVVAASGVVGRYLYGKVHIGLDGRKAEIAETIADADALRLLAGDGIARRLQNEMQALQQEFTSPRGGVVSAAWTYMRLAARSRKSRRTILIGARALIAESARHSGEGWRARRASLAAVRAQLDRYFGALRKAAAFVLFERLFALWHLLHLPLFILLVMAVIGHVVAVHLY